MNNSEIETALQMLDNLSARSSESGLSEDTCQALFGGPCPKALQRKPKLKQLDPDFKDDVLLVQNKHHLEISPHSEVHSSSKIERLDETNLNEETLILEKPSKEDGSYSMLELTENQNEDKSDLQSKLNQSEYIATVDGSINISVLELSKLDEADDINKKENHSEYQGVGKVSGDLKPSLNDAIGTNTYKSDDMRLSSSLNVIKLEKKLEQPESLIILPKQDTINTLNMNSVTSRKTIPSAPKMPIIENIEGDQLHTSLKEETSQTSAKLLSSVTNNRTVSIQTPFIQRSSYAQTTKITSNQKVFNNEQINDFVEPSVRTGLHRKNIIHKQSSANYKLQSTASTSSESPSTEFQNSCQDFDEGTSKSCLCICCIESSTKNQHCYKHIVKCKCPVPCKHESDSRKDEKSTIFRTYLSNNQTKHIPCCNKAVQTSKMLLDKQIFYTAVDGLELSKSPTHKNDLCSCYKNCNSDNMVLSKPKKNSMCSGDYSHMKYPRSFKDSHLAVACSSTDTENPRCFKRLGKNLMERGKVMEVVKNWRDDMH